MAFVPLNQKTHLTTGGSVLDHPLNLSLSLLFFTRGFPSQADLSHQEWSKGKMSRRNGGGRKVDLKLNLSPPIVHRRREESPNRSATMSPTSSCVSSENIGQDESSELRYASSPEATSMMLVGCPRCLMYVMLAEEYPKCPKCKSTVLLDVVHDSCTKKTRKT